MKRDFFIIFVIFATFFGGCSDDVRGIRLVIDSDFDVPEQLDQISILITASRTQEGNICIPAENTFLLSDGDDLPLYILVIEAQRYSSWMAYKVVGSDVSGAVTEQQNRIAFPQEGIEDFDVFLDRRCIDERCSGDAQCVDGGCVGIPVPGVFEDIDIRDPNVYCEPIE